MADSMTPEQVQALQDRGLIAPDTAAAWIAKLNADQAPVMSAVAPQPRPLASYDVPVEHNTAAMDAGSVNDPARVRTQHVDQNMSILDSLAGSAVNAGLAPPPQQIRPEDRPLVGPEVAGPTLAAKPAVDLAAPEAAAPGTLVGDQKTAGAPTVSSTAPAATIPGTVGGPAKAASSPPQTPEQNAAQQLLAHLATQQRDVATRSTLLTDDMAAKADAEQSKAIAVSAGYQAAAQDAQTKMELEQQRMADAKRDAEQADAESKVRAEAIAARKIDPNRVPGGSGVTYQKIFALVGSALGAMGASLTRTPNFAMQMIQSAIDHDVAAQRADIDNAKDSAAMLDKISRQKYGRALDQNALDARTRMDGYNYALAQTDAIGKSFDSPIAKANADILRQQLGGELAQQTLGLATQTYNVKKHEEDQKRALANAAGSQMQARLKQVEENKKRYQEMTAKFMENGDDLKTAQARALAVFGAGGQDNIGALPGKPKQGGSADNSAQNYGQLVKDADSAWQLVVDTNPSSVITAKGNEWFNTDQNSLRQAGLAALLGPIKRPGDSDQKAEERLQSVLPKPNDDAKTIARKKQIYDGMRLQAFQANNKKSSVSNPAEDTHGFTPED